jgi:hypothetical protein
MKLLVIPDSHAHPNYDNDRYEWLGKFIMDEMPDVIVNLGDHCDLPSLSSYDRGKRSFEGRRFARDCQAGWDAQDKLLTPMATFNDRQRRNAKRLYRPRMVMTLGNHEERINRITNDTPELEGAIGVEDLGYEEFGWEVSPYQVPVEIAGIHFNHCFATGVSGRPISGVNHARSLITKLHTSCVVGHSHMIDHAEQAKPDGTRIFGLVAGCYTHPDMIEGWNLATYHLWWRGVVMLDDLDGEGYYDEIRMITMRKLKRMYR